MHQDGYFQRVHRLSPTRFWINNPTLREARISIEAGAISCTTNPAYPSKQLVREDKDQAVAAIKDSIARSATPDEATDRAQLQIVKPIVGIFRPLWDKAPGQQGFVSVQGNPFHDEDARYMIDECLRARELGPNVIAKVPVTTAGLAAIEGLIAENMAVIATEVMSISQAIAAYETYRKASERSGNRPPYYVTHITGIFEEHLRSIVERDGIEIEDDLLWQAGLIVARKQYLLAKERGYPGIFLGGGARGLHHFTELVGGQVHITINWKGSADLLVEQDSPVVHRIGTPAPQYVIDELLEKIPDFRKAYEEDALGVDEFAQYGPVQLFRSSFVKGWRTLQEAIKDYGGLG
jgi:transaldolase